MFANLRTAALLGLFAASVGCVGSMNGTTGDDDSDDDPSDGTPTVDAGPPPPPPPPPPTYVRGSLPPLFQLTPRGEYGRMAHLDGQAMQDADFFARDGVGVSVEQKMLQLSAVLAAENPDDPPFNPFAQAGDQDRAKRMAFRGNPTDVKFLEVDGDTFAYVPLGGQLGRPNNEVAIVNTSNLNDPPDRITVGLRPQRVAIHPAGLVFVCNQYSNYISVIDAQEEELLQVNGETAEVATEYFCGDLTFVPQNPLQPDEEKQFLLVINRYRHSLLIYKVDINVDQATNEVSKFESSLVTEVTGIGLNPYRITIDEQKANAYVVSNRGGDIAKVSLAGLNTLPAGGSLPAPTRINAGTAVLDAVVIANKVIMPSRMIDRGLVDGSEEVPEDIDLGPQFVIGVNGQQEVGHPGAIFDETRAYNFEDVRNGILQYDLNLSTQRFYTDDNTPEAGYINQQKIINGASPMGIARNQAGTKVWIAMGGTDNVQEFNVNTAQQFSLTAVNGGNFNTDGHRPFQVTVDEANNRLYVVTWGSESLEIFNLQNRQRIGQPIDLGYAVPAYPASNIEEGELFYYNAQWSGNGRKSCENCHVDELVTDGLGYSNGASTPTGYHQVKPNHNLMTTNGYFWTGGMNNGDYTSVAYAAQTRVNCDLIAFGMTEGPASDPQTRVGDPSAKIQGLNDEDERCQPLAENPATGLPMNFAEIQQIIANQKVRRNQRIAQDATNVILNNGQQRDFLDVSKHMDFYSVSDLRLPPNPINVLLRRNQLATETRNKIERGETLFTQAGCAACHDPDSDRHPFTDAKSHGEGANWTSQFINAYQDDPFVLNIFQTDNDANTNGFPQTFIEGNTGSQNDTSVNMHPDPIAYFFPFCFSLDLCFGFEDPLAVQQGGALSLQTEEGRRVDLLVRVNLLDPERGFIPGNVRGQPQINTASLRGMWMQAGIMHHAYARSVLEAILGPGHPALRPGERGWAVSTGGKLDSHGKTSTMSREDAEAIEAYVLSIE